MDNPVLWILISIQVFMGAFDTLVHHESSERLAWRASQKTELRLHGVRNFFYTVIFLCFAWLEPHGVFTVMLAVMLAVEVLITLWDFVEEDMTRKLPWTERVNHTLLALNYGAVLALAAPYLWQWSFLPSALINEDSGRHVCQAKGVLEFAVKQQPPSELKEKPKWAGIRFTRRIHRRIPTLSWLTHCKGESIMLRQVAKSSPIWGVWVKK